MVFDKKASIELSMNFIVVMIICLLIMGVGIMLMAKVGDVSDEEIKKINEQHRAQLQIALDNGALVSIYPSKEDVARGEAKTFTLGIRNERDSATGKTDFCFDVFPDDANPINAKSAVISHYNPAKLIIDTKSKAMATINIQIPKTFVKGSYMFNVDVDLCDSPPSSYGNRQKLQINVR